MLIPILIHGFYDFCIYAIDADDLFILEFLIVYIALVILTFKIISKIREMSNIYSQSIKRGRIELQQGLFDQFCMLTFSDDASSGAL